MIKSGCTQKFKIGQKHMFPVTGKVQEKCQESQDFISPVTVDKEALENLKTTEKYKHSMKKYPLILR